MKKWTATLVSAAVITLSGSLVYGFGLPSTKMAMPGGGGGAGISKADIDSFLTLSTKADSLQNAAIQALGKILLNRDAVDAIDRKVAAAKAVQNPQESESALKQVMADAGAEIEKAANDKDAAGKLKNLSNDQKKQAGSALHNLFLSALTNKAAVNVATGIVKTAQANPMAAASYATQLPKVKDGLASLPGKVDKTYTLGNKLVQLAKANNIEVSMPTSEKAPAQEIDVK